MNTEKITTEERALKNDPRIMAQRSWELAKASFWPGKKFTVKLNRQVERNLFIYLAYSPDPYTAYCNFCSNIKGFHLVKNAHQAGLPVGTQERDKYLIKFLVGAFIEDFYKTADRDLFLEAMQLIMKIPLQELLEHWKSFLIMSNKIFNRLLIQTMHEMIFQKELEIDGGIPEETKEA